MAKEKEHTVGSGETTALENAAVEETDVDEAAEPAVGAERQSRAEGHSVQDTDTGETARLLQENGRLKIENKENIDNALRATAELDNIRKRTSRDIENARKYALERIVNELLPIIDSMELGIDAAQSAENIGSVREGMTLTLKKLFSCLDKFGVKPVDPVGEPFDPEWHEAISMQEEKGSNPGQILTVMQKGYELNGRLIRPAMVIVAK